MDNDVMVMDLGQKTAKRKRQKEALVIACVALRRGLSQYRVDDKGTEQMKRHHLAPNWLGALIEIANEMKFAERSFLLALWIGNRDAVLAVWSCPDFEVSVSYFFFLATFGVAISWN